MIGRNPALKVVTSSELVQFSMSSVMKMSDYMLISAISLSEMNVHRRVIGQIACDAAMAHHRSMSRRNLTRSLYVKVRSHE